MKSKLNPNLKKVKFTGVRTGVTEINLSGYMLHEQIVQVKYNRKPLTYKKDYAFVTLNGKEQNKLALTKGFWNKVKGNTVKIEVTYDPTLKVYVNKLKDEVIKTPVCYVAVETRDSEGRYNQQFMPFNIKLDDIKLYLNGMRLSKNSDADFTVKDTKLISLYQPFNNTDHLSADVEIEKR